MNPMPTPVLMFAERTEQVYFLESKHSPGFISAIEAHLAPHYFHPTDHDSAHYVTSLYFDSEEHEIAHSCEQGEQNVKLRAREYYELEPDATVRREPFIWLEVKTRKGGKTSKLRVGIPSGEVGAFLQGGIVSERMNSLRSSLWGESAEAILQEIMALCMRAAKPLMPDCLVHYRRRAWQDPSGMIRITLDSELAFYRPTPDIFSAGHTIMDVLVGPPVDRLTQDLVEIKLRGEMPAWLRTVIQSTRLEPAGEGRRPFSKFLAASHAVHLPAKKTG